MKKAIFFVALALVPVTSLVLVQTYLLHRQSEYLKIKNDLNESFEQTQLRQAELASELLNEPALIQNLDLQVYSAVGRILGGYTQIGKIDRLVLLNPDCQILAQSEQGLPLHAKCPVEQLASIKAPLSHWRASEEGPRLDRITPLNRPEGVVYLQISTYLQDSWIQASPNLHKQFQELGLRFTPASKWSSRVLWQQGSQESGGVQVFANDPWLLLFPDLIASPSLDLGHWLMASLTLLFLSLLYVWHKARGNEAFVKRTLSELTLWAEELEGRRRSAHAQANHQEHVSLQNLKDTMGKLIKRKVEDLEKLEHQNNLLQQQCVKLEARYIEQQADQVWLHQTQSLHQQMLSCARSYLEKLDETLSLADDISHVTSRELFKPAQRLFDLSSSWDLELRQQAPRKFVRSLSERVDETGVSQLDRELDSIIQDASHLSNTAVNVSMLTQRLLVDLRETLKLAHHWHAMMQGQDREQHKIIDLLQESQKLVKMQERSSHLQFDNRIDPEAIFDGLKIPGSTITSALFHVHQTLLETALDRDAHILQLSTQVKKRGERYALVLSLHTDDQDSLIPGSALPPKAEQHFTLAIQLLQSEAIKLTQLPPLPGVYGLALLWHPNQPSTDPFMARVERPKNEATLEGY